MDLYSILAQVEQDKEDAWIILLDIYKAFDSVSWSFLHRVMDTFMIPDSFMHWVELLYKDKEIRFMNNGHVSQPIRPSRGLAQGNGLSPLLFIMVIETLALSIRDNSQIQGIQFGDMQKKISLLADDAIVALKNDQISFTTLLQTLEYFATVSNLLVNKEKSVVLPVGGSSSHTRLQGMEEFQCQDQGYVNYLGATVPTPVTDESAQYRHSNYGGIKTYISVVLGPRNNLNYSLLEHILNTKAFVASKLNYIFSVAPSPLAPLLREGQSLLNTYIWDQGKHYLSAALMYQPWDMEGMGMYSCQYQNQALKLKWLNRLMLDYKIEFWAYQVSNCFVLSLTHIITFNCTYTHFNKLLKPGAILPLFWKDVFRIWCLHHYSKSPLAPGQMPLMFNSGIKSKRVFHLETFHELQSRNIVTVEQFLNQVHTMDQRMKGKIGVGRILKGIPCQWFQLIDSPASKPKNPTVWELSLTVPHTVRTITGHILDLVKVEPTRIWQKWQEELQVTDIHFHWKKVMANRLHITQMKMRTFYVKFVNRAFTLNTELKAWGRKDSDSCSLCGNFPETRVHLFWECEKVQPLWTTIIELCTQQVSTTELYTRNIFLLFGFGTPVINLLSTICKYHIHICRVFK